MTAPTGKNAKTRRQWPPLTDEAELITAIVKHLDRSQRQAISARCQGLRQDFRTRFTFEYDPDTDPTAKRDALVRINEHAALAAKAVADEALQDWDWLPKGEFAVRGRRFELGYGSTSLATLLWVLSELGKEAAGKLVLPKPPREREKDLTAQFSYMLVIEFPPHHGSKPRRISTASDDTWREKRQQPTASDGIVRDNRSYIEENWTRLPAKYQIAYNALLSEQNRWRRRHGQPPGPGPIPLAPTTDAIRRRRRRKEFQEPSTSPDGPFLSIAPLLFEYFTGRKPDKGLERFCRKVLKSLRPDKRRKRRAVRAKIGQTAP
jgi:hypothetical protein